MRVIKPQSQDETQNFSYAPPQIGIGKAGVIAVGEKQYNAKAKRDVPVSLDYFKINADKIYADKVYAVYGEKPTRITVIFPTEDERFNCNNYLELRNEQGKMCAFGDGENFKVLIDGKYEFRSKEFLIEKNGSIEAFKEKMLKYYGIDKPVDKAWLEKLDMRVIILGTETFAYYQFSTKGDDTSIPNLTSFYEAMLNTFGRVSMIPFDLTVSMQNSDKAGVFKRFPVVQAVPNLSIENQRFLLDHLSAGNVVKGLIDNAYLEGLKNQKQTLLIGNGNG